jgi:hypothetical protein
LRENSRDGENVWVFGAVGSGVVSFVTFVMKDQHQHQRLVTEKVYSKKFGYLSLQSQIISIR